LTDNVESKRYHTPRTYIQGICKSLSGQGSFGKKNCTAFFKQMPNFNLLLTVISDINGVLFALFNPVFVPYIRFITVNIGRYIRNLYFSIRLVLELNRLAKFVRVGLSRQPNLKMWHSEFAEQSGTFKVFIASWTRQSFIDTLHLARMFSVFYSFLYIIRLIAIVNKQKLKTILEIVWEMTFQKCYFWSGTTALFFWDN
jgi:hypothetical protein